MACFPTNPLFDAPARWGTRQNFRISSEFQKLEGGGYRMVKIW